GLRAYGQADPLVAYKKEAFEMYDQLRANIERDVVGMIYHVGILREPPPPPPAVRNVHENREPDAEAPPSPTRNGAPAGGGAPRAKAAPRANGAGRVPDPVGARKLGRNDPCYCGSGRKYKKCHGA